MIDIIFTILHLLAVIILFFVFYFLLRQPKKNIVIKLLTALMSVTLVWTILEVVANFQFFTIGTNLILVRLATAFVFPVVCLVFLSFLSIIFKKLPFWTIWILLPFIAVFFYLVFFTDKIIKDLLPQASVWEFNYISGDWFMLFSVFVFIPLLISLFLLLYKFFTTPKGVRRKQFGYLIIGLLVVIFFGAIPDLFFPLLGIENLYEVGNLAGVCLAVFVYYIVNKFGAFGNKVDRYPLKIRFTFAFIFVALVASASGASVFAYVLEDFLKLQFSQRLKIVAEDRGERVNHLLEDQIKKVDHLANADWLKQQLVSTKSSDNSLRDLTLHRQELLKDSLFQYFQEIFILDKKGVVMDSTKPLNIGENKAGQNYFLEGREKNYIQYFYTSPDNKNGYLAVSSPVLDNQGELLAVLVGIVDMREIFEVLGVKTGLGETGEAYLVNEDKNMITPSRFEEKLIFKKRIDTPNVSNCFAQKQIFREVDQPDHYFGSFEDYRGKEVLGTYAYIPQMNWCLLSEIDVEEIDSLFEQEFRNYYLLAFLILLLFASVFGYIFSYSISSPVLRLKEEVERAQKNNFNTKISLSGDDEFGKLAKAFSNMIKEVKESRSNIEKKVKNQTQDIEDKMKELKKVNKLMTGRELKMKELKEENEKLKKELKNKKD